MNIISVLDVVVILAIILTAVIFYNTIITKKWRNKVINEDECWKWGVFYYNPMDKRIFLPKRYGLGLTLNFAHTVSTVIMCVIAVIAILSIIFTIRK